MKKSRSLKRAMATRTIAVTFVFSTLMFVASSTKHYNNTISNINGVKSIEATHIISKYDNLNQTLQIKEVSSMAEAAVYGPDMPISFTGQMTAYNPVCKGCTGKVYCPPRQDVTNGNIYFDDTTYGHRL